MGKISKLATIAVAVLAVIVVGYFAIRSITALSQGYSWKEMDWNQDGNTSLSEFLASSDIGTRMVMRDKKSCVEYFRLKDGLPVRTDCKAA